MASAFLLMLVLASRSNGLAQPVDHAEFKADWKCPDFKRYVGSWYAVDARAVVTITPDGGLRTFAIDDHGILSGPSGSAGCDSARISNDFAAPSKRFVDWVGQGHSDSGQMVGAAFTFRDHDTAATLYEHEHRYLWRKVPPVTTEPFGDGRVLQKRCDGTSTRVPSDLRGTWSDQEGHVLRAVAPSHMFWSSDYPAAPLREVPWCVTSLHLLTLQTRGARGEAVLTTFHYLVFARAALILNATRFFSVG